MCSSDLFPSHDTPHPFTQSSFFIISHFLRPLKFPTKTPIFMGAKFSTFCYFYKVFLLHTSRARNIIHFFTIFDFSFKRIFYPICFIKYDATHRNITAYPAKKITLGYLLPSTDYNPFHSFTIWYPFVSSIKCWSISPTLPTMT